MPVRKFHVSMPEDVYAKVVERSSGEGERSAAISSGLSRYYELVGLAWHEIGASLTRPELHAIANAIGSTLNRNVQTIRDLETLDTLASAIIARAGDDSRERRALLRKFRKLSPTARLALLEEAETKYTKEARA